MGTQFGIAVYAPDAETANRACAIAFRRVAELEETLSDYDPESELSRLSHAAPTNAPVRVSDDLWKMLVESQRLSKETEGAFDITVGPLTKLWRSSRRTKQLPSLEKVTEARGGVGYSLIQLHPETQSVSLTGNHMRLDLGGIAKGFAGDEALRIIQAQGLASALVSSGGGLSLGAPPPGEKGWKIGLAGLDPDAEPLRIVLLSHCGVATAGDAAQFVEIDGQRYSHILDPRTAQPLQRRISVSIIAPNGLIADALDTPINIMGIEAGKRFLEKEHPEVSAQLVWQEGEETKVEFIQSRVHPISM